MSLVSSDIAIDDGRTESREVRKDRSSSEEKLTIGSDEREVISGEGAMESALLCISIISEEEDKRDTLIGVGGNGRRKNEVSSELVAVETSTNSRELVGAKSETSGSILLNDGNTVAKDGASSVASGVSCADSVMLEGMAPTSVSATVGRRTRGSEVDEKSRMEITEV